MSMKHCTTRHTIDVCVLHCNYKDGTVLEIQRLELFDCVMYYLLYCTVSRRNHTASAAYCLYCCFVVKLKTPVNEPLMICTRS
jgi:hypothetical protein